MKSLRKTIAFALGCMMALSVFAINGTVYGAGETLSDSEIAANDRILYFVNCGGFPSLTEDINYTYVPMAYKLGTNETPEDIDYHWFKTGLLQTDGILDKTEYSDAGGGWSWGLVTSDSSTSTISGADGVWRRTRNIASGKTSANGIGYKFEVPDGKQYDIEVGLMLPDNGWASRNMKVQINGADTVATSGNTITISDNQLALIGTGTPSVTDTYYYQFSRGATALVAASNNTNAVVNHYGDNNSNANAANHQLGTRMFLNFNGKPDSNGSISVNVVQQGAGSDSSNPVVSYIIVRMAEDQLDPTAMWEGYHDLYSVAHHEPDKYKPEDVGVEHNSTTNNSEWASSYTYGSYNNGALFNTSAAGAIEFNSRNTATVYNPQMRVVIGDWTTYENAYENARINKNEANVTAMRTAFKKLQPARSSFVNGFKSEAYNSPDTARWYDTNGNPIQAHGGQIIQNPTYDENITSLSDSRHWKWLWYGEDKSQGGTPSGTRGYWSNDLYNWHDMGDVLMTMPRASTINPSWSASTDISSQANQDILKTWLTSNASNPQAAMWNDFYGDLSWEDFRQVYRALRKDATVFERPKVLYNPTTKEWVLYWHSEGYYSLDGRNNGTGSYSKAAMGFAVSDTPNGPFKVAQVRRMHYNPGSYDSSPGMARDMNVLVDYDGTTAYAFYSSEENATLIVSKLNSAWTDVVNVEPTIFNQSTGTLYQSNNAAGAGYLAIRGTSGTDYVRAFTSSKEAPAPFKYNGKYYMVTSGTDGWSPNQGNWQQSTNLLGSWTNNSTPYLNDTERANNGSTGTQFQTQPTNVITIDYDKGQFILMSDRWFCPSASNAANSWERGSNAKISDSRYVWLPVEFTSTGAVQLKFVEEWRWEDSKSFTPPPPQLENVSTIYVRKNTRTDLPATLPDVRIGTVTHTGTTSLVYDNSEITAGLATVGDKIISAKAILPNNTVADISLSIRVVPYYLKYFYDPGDTSDSFAKIRALTTQNFEMMNTAAWSIGVTTGGNFGRYSVNSSGSFINSTATSALTSSNDMYTSMAHTTGNGDRICFNLLQLNNSPYNYYVGNYMPTSWGSSRTLSINSSADPQTGSLTAPGLAHFGTLGYTATATPAIYTFSGTTNSGQVRLGFSVSGGQPMVSFLMVEETSTPIPTPESYAVTLNKSAVGIASYSAPFASASATSVTRGTTGANVLYSSTGGNTGGNLTFTITPAEGYTLQDATASNGTVTVVGNTIIVRNITDACSIDIIMAPKMFTVTYVIAGSGAGGTVSDNANVEYGGSTTLTITPDAGFSIVDVALADSNTATLSGSDNTRTIGEVKADTTVYIRFSSGLTAKRSGSDITPTYVNNGTTAVSGSFIVGVYSASDGRLVKIGSAEFTAEADSTATTTVFNNFVSGLDTPAYYYKVFSWNADYIPITESCKIIS